MNWRMISYILGVMMKSEGCLMLLSVIVALVFGEMSVLSSIIIPAALLLIGGFILSFRSPERGQFYAKEGFVVVALSWIIVSFFGGLPFFLSGEIPSLVDSFFESVSGFTTTGSTILKNIEGMSYSLLFWRSFTHWIGGMGILVFVLSVMPRSGGDSIYLMRAEMPGVSVEKLVSKVRPTIQILYGIYICLTVVLIILLVICGMPVFDSIVTAMGTAGTGGYGIKNSSIAFYDSAAIDAVLTVFMLIFSINFNLYFLILIGKVKNVLKSEELHWFLGIVGTAIVLIAVNILQFHDGNLLEALRYSSFQVASIISTSGFSTEDFGQWPQFSQTVLFLLMFVGACAGSTGGGIKVSRLVILGKMAVAELKRILHPRHVVAVKFEDKTLSAPLIKGAYTYFVIYFFVLLISVLILSLDNFDLTTNFTAVVTCLNNVGPGLGAVGPSGNFADFSILSKLVLCFGMLAGRLEIFPILLLFSPFTWKK